VGEVRLADRPLFDMNQVVHLRNRDGAVIDGGGGGSVTGTTRGERERAREYKSGESLHERNPLENRGRKDAKSTPRLSEGSLTPPRATSLGGIRSLPPRSAWVRE